MSSRRKQLELRPRNLAHRPTAVALAPIDQRRVATGSAREQALYAPPGVTEVAAAEQQGVVQHMIELVKLATHLPPGFEGPGGLVGFEEFRTETAEQRRHRQIA